MPFFVIENPEKKELRTRFELEIGETFCEVFFEYSFLYDNWTLVVRADEIVSSCKIATGMNLLNQFPIFQGFEIFCTGPDGQIPNGNNIDLFTFFLFEPDDGGN
jgi:hypothetical protein